MELAAITAQQVVALFILILAGFVAAKAGALPLSGKKILTDLLMFLVMPSMLLDSFIREYDPSTFHNLMQSFGISALLLLTGFAVTFLCTCRMQHADKHILRVACMFANVGYMGIPLIRALFGEEGVLYASAFVAVFNFLLFSVGYAMVNREIQAKDIVQSILRNPCMIAIVCGICLYLFQIPVPTILAQPLGMVGDMTTPLAMILTGMTIAGSSWAQLGKEKKSVLLACGIRLVMIPLVTLLLCRVLGFTGLVVTIALIQEACPAAALTTVFAVKYHHNEDLAAGAVVITTLLSILTLPLFTLLIQLVLG